MLLMLSLIALAPETMSARDCAEIFGDENDVSENREIREARLNFVIDSGAHVSVDHSYDWSDPIETEIRNLELIDTSSRTTARVEFFPSREGVDCEDGIYTLSVDDSLGHDGRVLTVLERGLLIELEGELRYLLPEHGEPIDFTVAWTSPFGIPRRSRLVAPPKPARRRK